MRSANKKNMRPGIAHIMPWSGIGGVEIATLRMTKATHDQFRHIAFCLEDAVLLRESFERIGIETRVYFPPTPSLRHAARFYRESKQFARQLRKDGVNIVHFSETAAAEPNSLAAYLARARIVCHVRNTYPHLSLHQRIPLYPIDQFIFVSQEARNKFALSLPDRMAQVIYDAIELPPVEDVPNSAEVRRKLEIPIGCTVVGMVARVNPQKDYFTLAAAATLVLKKYPDVRFLVVGDNSLVDLNRSHFSLVFKYLTELGIANRFIFTGHRNDVSRLISAMDISVLSTHREGFGLCVAESMAMQKPVIATAVGGLLEVVQHGVTGYLYAHENSQELADEIISLIEHPEDARRIAIAGYEHVKRDYSQQSFIDKISKVYWDLMNQ